jgi:hypothetical protein
VEGSDGADEQGDRGRELSEPAAAWSGAAHERIAEAFVPTCRRIVDTLAPKRCDRYADGEFDGAAPAFGTVFARDHELAASELTLMCRPGGSFAITAWLPGEWFYPGRRLRPDYEGTDERESEGWEYKQLPGGGSLNREYVLILGARR